MAHDTPRTIIDQHIGTPVHDGGLTMKTGIGTDHTPCTMPDRKGRMPQGTLRIPKREGGYGLTGAIEVAGTPVFFPGTEIKKRFKEVMLALGA